jgi:type I restriction enzyme, S subunit
MGLNEGYKRREVGEIPDQWEPMTLGDFVSLRRGHDLTWRDRRQGNVPVMGSAGQNGSHDISLAKGPGVVLGRSGASFGQAYYCERDYWPHNTALYVTDFRGNEPLFVFYFLSSIDFSRHNSGGAQQSLNRNFIYPIPVQVPRPAEQRTIAAALSDVDALLLKLDHFIAKKRDLQQGAMQQLLSGRLRLPGFHNEWVVKRLKDIVQEFIVPMRDKPKKFSGAIPWCRIEDFDGKYLIGSKSGQMVDQATIGEMNLKVNPIGTLLVSCSADLGRCAIVGIPLVTNQTFIGLVLNASAASNEFMYYYMTSKAEELNTLSSGTTISYLSRGHFESYEVRIPIEVKEQAAIATVLSDMDAEISGLEQRRDKTHALKQGMMQELLSGRTRLV